MATKEQRDAVRAGVYIRLPPDQSDRIIANLALWNDSVRYSVKTALRETARSTVRSAARHIAGELGLKQYQIAGRRASKKTGAPAKRGRVGAFYRQRKNQPIYRAWMGTRAPAPASAKLKPDQEAEARRQGYFKVARTTRGLKAGWYRRIGKNRFPVKRYQASLEPFGQWFIANAHEHWRVDYRLVMRRELRARLKRAKTVGQARQIRAALAIQERIISRQGAI